jgi:hypothetical protein
MRSYLFMIPAVRRKPGSLVPLELDICRGAAAETPAPQSTAAFRHEIIRCAGAFFSSPR